MHYLICDIDACFSDDSWRHHYIEHIADGAHEGKEEKAFHEYNSRCGEDHPIFANMSLLHLIINCFFGRERDNLRLLFFTARPFRYHGETLHWIKHKLLPRLEVHFELHMRANNDNRRSPDVKMDFLRGVKRSPLDFIMAFDDRGDVIDMYRANNICAARLAAPNKMFHDDNEGVRAALEYFLPDGQAARGIVARWLNFGFEPKEADGPERPQPFLTFGLAAEPCKSKVAPVLRAMAETAEARAKVYGDRFDAVPALINVLFPAGVPQHLVTDPRWYIFEMVLGKLVRYSNQHFGHIDSAHDAGVYCAILQTLTEEAKQ